MHGAGGQKRAYVSRHCGWGQRGRIGIAAWLQRLVWAKLRGEQ